MRATLMWVSVDVVLGVRIVQCHVITDVVIGFRVMFCHAIMDETHCVTLLVPSSHREAPKPEVSVSPQEHNKAPLPPLPSRPTCERLELLSLMMTFCQALPRSDQFTTWATMILEGILAEHVVDNSQNCGRFL